MKKWITSLLTIVLLISISSCSKHTDKEVPNPTNAVYYWKTIFRIDSPEATFLKRHNIRKIYLRLFDVDYNAQGVPIPIGTVQFKSKIPKGIQIIPVIYIENHCLDKADGLAAKIVKRVLTMADTNQFSINELQIDYDWTNSSRASYFTLLSEIKKLLNEQGKFLLSATIRLHQLSQPTPPVDYGVLMCYNTGNLHEYQAESSILSIKDVLPFVYRRLANYTLPLCGAYPIFSWNLLFEQQQFRTILHEVDLSDTTLYRKISDRNYKVLRSHTVSIPDPNSFGLMVRAGDEIKRDEVSIQTILEVQRLLESKRHNIDRQVILFSLNSINNNKFTAHEMDQIYSH